MSVNEKLRNPLNNQLFEAILALKQSTNVMSFLKIFVRSMN